MGQEEKKEEEEKKRGKNVAPFPVPGRPYHLRADEHGQRTIPVESVLGKPARFFPLFRQYTPQTPRALASPINSKIGLCVAGILLKEEEHGARACSGRAA